MELSSFKPEKTKNDLYFSKKSSPRISGRLMMKPQNN